MHDCTVVQNGRALWVGELGVLRVRLFRVSGGKSLYVRHMLWVAQECASTFSYVCPSREVGRGAYAADS